jgi:hypothetical protein
MSLGMNDLVEWQRMRLQAAETLEKLSQQHSDLILAFADRIRGNRGPAVTTGKALAAAVHAFLGERKVPATVSEISNGTGLSGEAVRSILLANRDKLFEWTSNPAKPKGKLWSAKPGSSGADAAASPAYIRRDAKRTGVTAAVVAYMQEHPKGSTLADLTAALSEQVKSDSKNKSQLIRSTVLQLVKTGKAVADRDGLAHSRLFRLIKGPNGYKGNAYSRKKRNPRQR